MVKEVKIPDIAENVEHGLIASVLVSEGDEVSADQAIVEIETDKASTEIPTEFAGIVKELKVSQGDEVDVNQVIALIETNDEDESSGEDEEKKEDADETSAKKKEDSSDKPEAKQEPDKEDEETSKEEAKSQSKSGDDADRKSAVSPLARKIARENDVDLDNIEGSGPGNRISRADVEDYIQEGKPDKSQKGKQTASMQEGEREKLSNIGKITAETMQQAWQTIPHVTQFDEADITDLEKFRQEHKQLAEKQGGKLTITAILLKISAFALQKYPRFNTSLDWEKQELIKKTNYHIGVAVDTPQGLLVPVVRDVNRKSLSELAAELTDVAKRAREKKISPDEMQGGNFTISNLGGIGGTGFTPIVYPPQVAILGVSEAKFQQVFRKDEFQKRLVMPLSLSYDHRVINGADGARFLKWFCNVLEDPYGLLF